MTVRVTHTKVSGAPAPSDPSLVGGPDWNADHAIVGLDIATDNGLSVTASAAVNTLAIQAAIDATPYGGKCVLPAGNFLYNGGLTRTTPIEFCGAGPSGTQLVLASTVANTVDGLLIKPTAAGSGYNVHDVGFVGQGGGNFGRHHLHIDTTNGGAAAYNFVVERCLGLATAAGNSLKVTNTQATGGVFNSRFADNNFESYYLENVGDSIIVDGGSCNSTSTTHPGIYASQVAGSGALQIVGVNISTLNGHIIIDSGVEPIIRDCILETPAGTNLHGSMIDINGGVANISAPQLLNNQIQVTTLATGTPPIPIRINNAANAKVVGGRLAVRTGNQVTITASATDTELDQATQAVVADVIQSALSVSDAGTRTSYKLGFTTSYVNAVLIGNGNGAGFASNLGTNGGVFIAKTGAPPVFASVTGDISIGTPDGSNNSAWSIASHAVSNTKFRQSAALSVVGNAGSSTADVADIAGTANQVLRINSAGTALAFGAVNLAAAAAITGVLPAANGGAGTITGALKANGSGTVSQAAAADLSDYAQGTWTPVLAAASGGPATYTIQSASYERIGRLVIARFNIVTSGLGALSGSLKITGLPLTSANTANDKGTCGITSWSGFALDANYTNVGGVILPNTSEILLMENGSTSGAASFQLVAANIAAATTIIGTAMYHV